MSNQQKERKDSEVKKRKSQKNRKSIQQKETKSSEVKNKKKQKIVQKKVQKTYKNNRTKEKVTKKKKREKEIYENFQSVDLIQLKSLKMDLRLIDTKVLLRRAKWDEPWPFLWRFGRNWSTMNGLDRAMLVCKPSQHSRRFVKVSRPRSSPHDSTSQCF